MVLVSREVGEREGGGDRNLFLIFLRFECLDFESLGRVQGGLGFEDFSECGGFLARFLGAVWRIGGELL